jgi:hypothetical protein
MRGKQILYEGFCDREQHSLKEEKIVEEGTLWLGRDGQV